MDRLSLTPDSLPSSFKNEIVKSNEDSILIRSNLCNMDDINKWVKDFGVKTNTRWNVRDSKPNGQKFVCWKKFICHHSAFQKVVTPSRKSKSANCEASLLVKIKLNTARVRAVDPFTKRGLRAVIIIQNKHSHLLVTAETLRFLPATEDVREKFFEYFNDGMGIAESCHYHESVLELQEGFTEVELASGSVNPTQRTVRYWYDQWRQLKLKPRNGVGCKIIEKTNETQENSSSSEEEQEEEYEFPMPTAARTTVPFVERYDLLNHRQPTSKSDPKSSSPQLTAKRQRHNPTSKKILHQVPENTSLSEQTSEPDEFTHFGNNVAHQLRSMPLEKALLCQIEITKVLSKYKFDVDHQHLHPSQDMLSPPIEASTQHFKREKS